MNNIKKEMILPKIQMEKAIIRKTLIDENGLTYEVEEEIEVPIINDINTIQKKKENNQ